MARVHTIGKTVIWVYADDHLPAHFHVLNPDFRAIVEIETLRIYSGSLKGAAGKAALDWAAQNIDLLKATWNRLNPNYPVK